MKNQSLLISFFILLVFSSMFNSCDRIGEDDTYIYNPKIIWKIRTDNNTVFTSYASIDVSQYYITVINHTEDVNDHNRILSVYNIESGEKHPAWNNNLLVEYLNGPDSPVSISFAGINEDVIIVSSSNSIKAYSLATQALLWEKSYGVSLYRKPIILGNKAYFATGPNSSSSNVSNDYCYIYEFDVYTGVNSDIIGYNNFASFNPEVYFTETGDTLLIYQGRNNISAYNIGTNILEWEVPFNSFSQTTLNYKSFIQDDMFYFVVGRYFYCLDIESKTILYNKDLEYDVFTYHNIIADNYMFFYASDKYVKCYDKSKINAPLLWTKTTECTSTGYIIGHMAYYNGSLYTTIVEEGYNSNLHCIDAATGNVLWKAQDMHSLIHPYIDYERGIMYTADRQYLYAIDLNNSPVITEE